MRAMPPGHDPRVVSLRFRGVGSVGRIVLLAYTIPIHVCAIQKPARCEVSDRCVFRSSDPTSRPGARRRGAPYPEIHAFSHPEHLSCGCAHSRVQPGAACRSAVAHHELAVAKQAVASLHTNDPHERSGRLLSWSFVPLRRVSPSEATPPRLADTEYVPPSGFLTLSAACSSLERPALFHAGNAHGVSPSRGFPSLPGPTARHSGIALLTFLPRIGQSVARSGRRRASREGAYRAVPERRVRRLVRLQGLAPTTSPFRRCRG
jgi:hypothetical protein